MTEQEIEVVIKACKTYKPGSDYAYFGSGPFEVQGAIDAARVANENSELIEEFA